MTTSPVALFVYNRPDHTQRTVEALQNNHLAAESELIIFSDGPKNDADNEKVRAVRGYIRTINGFKKVNLIHSEKNLGLSRSIINGVTEIVRRFGRVIVLEDDLVTSPYFLQYMNEALTLYENEPRVASIHGFIYPIKEKLPEIFFLRGADCWGWATWKRAWNMFEPDGQRLLQELEAKRLIKKFDLDDSYGFSSMLRRQIDGQNDSWAIRWHASAYLRNMLTLYPGISLVDNIGQGSSGTHKGSSLFKYSSLESRKVGVGGIPIEENAEARNILIEYFRSLKPTLLIRAKNLLRKIV